MDTYTDNASLWCVYTIYICGLLQTLIPEVSNNIAQMLVGSCVAPRCKASSYVVEVCHLDFSQILWCMYLIHLILNKDQPPERRAIKEQRHDSCQLLYTSGKTMKQPTLRKNLFLSSSVLVDINHKKSLMVNFRLLKQSSSIKKEVSRIWLETLRLMGQ